MNLQAVAPKLTLQSATVFGKVAVFQSSVCALFMIPTCWWWFYKPKHKDKLDPYQSKEKEYFFLALLSSNFFFSPLYAL